MENQELETCINEYGKDIYSFCRYLTCSRQEADDLYQDTFLKAMEIGGRIDSSHNPKSYLLSIALRIWKNRKRKFSWRKRIADTQAIMDERDVGNGDLKTASPEEQLMDREERRIVRQAVDKLPERLRITVLLFYMEEMQVKQIAELLKIPVGTVLSRLHQARKILKKELEIVLNGKRIE